MTPVYDDQRGRRGAHRGHLALHGDRVARAGNEIVHRHAHLDDVAEGRQLGSQQIGQLTQHAKRLPLFLDFRLAQRVAQLDRLGRLDEERARAARFVVDDPGRARRASRGGRE